MALTAATATLFNPTFYFLADTAEGAYGQWFELGQQVRAGHWPLMNPDAWMAGNYVAEGQWGLWNPLVLLIGVLVSFGGNAVVVSTGVKLVFLAIGAVGFHLWARHLGAPVGWAVLAGFTAALAGQTIFQDAASWVTNLMVWAWFGWSAWALQRFSTRQGSVFWPIATTYLMITVGYAQGTLMLILLYAALLGDAAVRRHWDKALRLFSVGVVSGLFALAVFLPGLLTSSVTERTDEILNNGFMVLSLSGLATAATPASRGHLPGWWGDYAHVPFLYIAWFLPLVALVPSSVWRAHRRTLSALGVFAALVLVWSMGPSEIGPLRFPARSLPWLASSVVAGLIVLLAAAAREAVPRRGSRLWLALSFMAFSAWVNIAAVPEAADRTYKFGLVTAVAIVGAWWLLGHADARVRTRLLPWLMVAVGVFLAVAQFRAFAPQLQSRSDVPVEVDSYLEATPPGAGDGIIVGDPLSLGSDLWDETAFGNAWYLVDDVRVQNLYTPVGFEAYSQDLCLAYDGRTCPQLVERLFAEDRTTGLMLVDLLSLDVVQVLASKEHPAGTLGSLPVPTGWSRAEVTDQAVTWVRDGSTGTAGGVVYASPGVEVTGYVSRPDEVTVQLGAVPAGGGQVAFSRLAWPGYEASGAQLADPLRGYLVVLDVPASAAGGSVALTFRPPGWMAVMAAMGAAVLLTVGFLVLEVRAKRRTPAD